MAKSKVVGVSVKSGEYQGHAYKNLVLYTLSKSKEVAEIIGTTQQQINKYENEQQEMTLQRAIKLAELYKVSLDYLAGREK